MPLGFAGLEQAPVWGSHVPASWHWSAVQVTELPAQIPLWQLSLSVHALPSSHDVPSVFGVATQLFVRPSVAHVPVLHASFSAEQSLFSVQRTALMHSVGEELADDDEYEQTSISSGVVPIGKSPRLTQHCACASCVEQSVPLQTFPLPCAPVNGSATALTVQEDAAVIWVDPPQFSSLLLSHE